MMSQGGISVAEMLHGLYRVGQKIVAKLHARRVVPHKDALIGGMRFKCGCMILIHHR